MPALSRSLMRLVSTASGCAGCIPMVHWAASPPIRLSAPAKPRPDSAGSARLIVILIERQPGGGHSTTGDTRCHQGGFAKTGGGGDQGQRVAESFRNLRLQPWRGTKFGRTKGRRSFVRMRGLILLIISLSSYMGKYIHFALSTRSIRKFGFAALLGRRSLGEVGAQ